MINKYEKIIKDNLISKFIKDIKPKNLIQELKNINSFMEKYEADNFPDYDKHVKDNFYLEINKNKLKFYKDLIDIQKKLFNKAMKEKLGYEIAISNSDIINDFSLGLTGNYSKLYDKQVDELVNNIVENDKVVDLFNHFYKIIENKNRNNSIVFNNSIVYDLFTEYPEEARLFLNILHDKKYNFDIEKLKILKKIRSICSKVQSVYEEYYNLCFIKKFNILTNSKKLDFMMENNQLIIDKEECIERDKILEVFDILKNNKELRKEFYEKSYNYGDKYISKYNTVPRTIEVKDSDKLFISSDGLISIHFKDNNPLMYYVYQNYKELFILYYEECILSNYIKTIESTLLEHNKFLSFLKGELK